MLGTGSLKNRRAPILRSAAALEAEGEGPDVVILSSHDDKAHNDDDDDYGSIVLLEDQEK